jgi:hypothetical protein
VCLQELANRLVAGEEAIYEGLPDVAAASTLVGTDSNITSCIRGSQLAVQLLQVDPSLALKQLISTLRTWLNVCHGM